jgi:hypothetical protein
MTALCQQGLVLEKNGETAHDQQGEEFDAPKRSLLVLENCLISRAWLICSEIRNPHSAFLPLECLLPNSVTTL